MNISIRICISILLVLIQCFESFGQENKIKETLEAEGRIVAYDNLASSINAGFNTHTEILVMKVSKTIKGKEDSKYIKIHFWHYAEDPAPPELFDGNLVWRLGLVRTDICDGKLSDIEYVVVGKEDGTKQKTSTKRLLATKGAENEEFPKETILPCYFLFRNFRVVQEK